MPNKKAGSDRIEKNRRTRIVVALVSVYIFWGSTYLAIRIAIEGFPPLTMAGIRYIIAGAIMYAFARLRGSPAPGRPEWIGAGIVGAFLLLGGNGGVVWAEQWVPSAIAALAIGTVPLWTVFFSFFRGHRSNKKELAGLVLGFCGIVLLNFEEGLQTSPSGAIALIIAAASWSLGSVLSRGLRLPPALMASAAEMLVGGVLLLLAGAAGGERISCMPETRSLWALLYLIVFGSIVGFSSYVYLLGRVRPSLATSYAYVNPVIAVILGIGLAGESISLKGILAMAVIIPAVLLVLAGSNKTGDSGV